MAEIVVVLAILALTLLAALPNLRGLLEQRALDAAADRLAGGAAMTRHRAIAAGKYAGMVISSGAAGDSYTIHLDGGSPGIRSSEVAAGIDPLVAGPVPINLPGDPVRLGIPTAPPVPSIPPSGGWLPPGGDPVRLGSADILSFSPIGESSSGSIYLTDGRGGVRAVVVYGRSGRIRRWAWEPGGTWLRQ
jgi:type II secretory pathway pseudopilin PulG